MVRPEKTDGRVSRAQRQRELRRAAVLEAARSAFSQKGYHATSIDDIIEAAGIARGTFYLYFQSKRAIFDELLDELFRTLQGVVRRIETGSGARPPVEQLNGTVGKVLDTLYENRDMARILLREAVGIDEDFDRKLADFYGRIEAMITSALRNGQAMGLVRSCEPQVVARAILGAVKEVIQWAYVDQNPDAVVADAVVDRSRLGRELIAFSLNGLFHHGE
jgi:AcrR family transcriptional regulator